MNPSSLALVLLASSLHLSPAGPTIRLNGQTAPTVDVTGIDAKTLDALARREEKSDEWTALLALYVEPADGGDPTRRPAMLGTYSVAEGVLRFTPRFPLSPGVRYRAVFHPDRLPGRSDSAPAVETTLSLPKAKRAEATAVERVYPSADRLPENQLKFYFHFTGSMSRGEAYQRIHLLDSAGKQIEGSFLELGEELWDPEVKRFTLFVDPGRIKRGLKPREDVGPALEKGKRYTLLIDREWADAEGDPLKEAYRKTFTVDAPDETPPDPKTWRLQSPAAGERTALAVVFPKSMDHALLNRLVWVADAEGKRVEGAVSVTDAETRWSFTPREPWAPGKYQLVADKRLEDLAGNSIGRPFEVDVFHPIQTETKTETVQIPFEVK